MSMLDDLRQLDPKQPGNWPWLVKAGAFLLIFLLIQVAAYFLLWQGQTEQIEKGRQDVEKQKEAFLEKKKLAVNLEAYKQQRVEIEQSFGALLKQLPNKSEMDALLIDINQAGLGRGLAFDLFKPAEKENFTEFYAELPADIKIDPPKEGLLSMEAVAKTYRYLDAEEIAKQRQANKPKPGAKK